MAEVEISQAVGAENEESGQADTQKEKQENVSRANDDNAVGGNEKNDGELSREEKAERFRQAVLKVKRAGAARTEGIISLAAKLCGADKSDYDGIESALSERDFEYRRRNDMEYRLGQWQAESERVREIYPEFDLMREMGDRRFFSLCYKGVGLAEAYLIIHKDELFTAAMEYAASEIMRSGIFSSIGRAREGMLSAAGNTPTREKRLSKSDRRELIRRTERGERVVL